MDPIAEQYRPLYCLDQEVGSKLMAILSGTIGATGYLEQQRDEFSIYNNTVYNNARLGKSYGGIVWGSGTGVIIKNNIAYQNGVADIADSNGVQTPTFGANLCTFATTGCARSGNPLFVDPTSTNYQLQSGSPAIDAGAILTQVPAYDMNGTPRPQGAGWDIGAYER
jgi:hypothetical protein